MFDKVYVKAVVKTVHIQQLSVHFFRRGTLTFPKSALTEFEKQTETENGEVLRVDWYESIFPATDCKPEDVKTSLEKITLKKKKEVIQRAENHFAQVLGTFLTDIKPNTSSRN